jgi:predicted RNase H-like nuclease (RuvC/YqgF family)
MKSLTLVLCVIAILGSAASTFFYFEIGKTKEELKQQVATAQTNSNELQAKLLESTTQGEALQRRLASLDSDLGEAKSKTSSAESRSAQLNRDIAQLRNQLTAKDDAEQGLNREISQLKREIAQTKLAAMASASPEEVEGYKATIASLQSRMTELESSRTTVASGRGNSASSAGGSSDLKAEVVSIGSQNAFVVLNVGAGKGVQAGQNFSIVRNGATVATAQVSSVNDNYSVAQIVANSLRGGLVKGDSAALNTQ